VTDRQTDRRINRRLTEPMRKDAARYHKRKLNNIPTDVVVEDQTISNAP